MRIVARTSRGILSPRRALGFLARAHVSGSAAPLNLLGGCLDGGLAALFYFATPLDIVLTLSGCVAMIGAGVCQVQSAVPLPVAHAAAE